MKDKETKPIPTSKIHRTGKVGLTAVAVGVSEAKLRVKRSLGLGSQASENNTRETQAEKIFKTLSQLRGSALKAAQILAQAADFVPEQYQKVLAQAYNQAPALNRAIVRKVFVTELGKAPEDCFDEFESEAFAAASLGQVHNAKYKGKNWAVKIQYPGIGDTLDSDLNLIKTLLKPMTSLDNLQPLLDEVHEHFILETDYTNELQELLYFKGALKESLVKIAEPLKEFSTGRILVTEKLEGLHLDDWLKTNPSQKQRNHMGQLLIDLWDYGVMHLERLHADPNPGNFLFLPDGRLGLLDFGCIKHYQSGFKVKYRNFLEALLTEDIMNIRSALAAVGVTYHDDPEANRFLSALSSWYIRPFKDKAFDFNSHHGYIKEGAYLMHKLHEHCGQMSRDFVLTDRTWLGVYRTLEAMGATVSMDINRKLLWS
ncbi:MAG: AarF/ABC1/UbiB kinase family protein [SAR324 cluster bacterium]|nr:AarF/ABC1/UbiB kinase family protein [SAR324 cluster bacterium]